MDLRTRKGFWEESIKSRANDWKRKKGGERGKLIGQRFHKEEESNLSWFEVQSTEETTKNRREVEGSESKGVYEEWDKTSKKRMVART